MSPLLWLNSIVLHWLPYRYAPSRHLIVKDFPKVGTAKFGESCIVSISLSIPSRHQIAVPVRPSVAGRICELIQLLICGINPKLNGLGMRWSSWWSKRNLRSSRPRLVRVKHRFQANMSLAVALASSLAVVPCSAI